MPWGVISPCIRLYKFIILYNIKIVNIILKRPKEDWMKFKHRIICFLAFALFISTAFCNTANAKCEDSRKVIKAANKVIAMPNAINTERYISVMKRRVIIHGFKKDYEAQADDCRSILYFLRKNKKSADYGKYFSILNESYTKLGFKNNQNNRLEIAKNLYLEEKYFAAGFEFLELASVDYSPEICYEYLGDISEKFNNPKSAAIFYKKALEIEPENYCVTYKLGRLYKATGKEDDAKEYFEKTINLCEDDEILDEIVNLYENDLKNTPQGEQESEISYEILGLAYQKLGKYQKTLELFNKALQLKPDDIFLKYYLGNLLFDMAEYANAIEVYNSILAKNPYETQIRIARAKCYKANGMLNAAIKDYQVVLALYPNSMQAQYGLYKLLSGKNPDTVIKAFYPLNKNFVPNADFYNNLASVLYQKGMVKDAINVYKMAIAKAPKAERAYVQLYKIYELEGNKAKGYELIQTAYKNLPNSPEIKKLYNSSRATTTGAKNSVALSYMANKEYAKALKIYNQIEPKDVALYESIAICHKSLKDYKAAIDSLSKAIKLDPVNSDLYYNTALLYLDLNSKKIAETYLEKAIGLDKANLKARKLLSYIKQQEVDKSLDKAYSLYKKKDYKNTLAELNRAEKLYPNNPEVYYYKALTYKALGDSNNAFNFFEKTLSYDRAYYTCHFYMAEILEKRGKEKDALEEYERFLGAEVEDQNMLKKAQNKVIELGKKYY